MNRLSTGLVIAGAYADKVRRTLFAQTRQAGVSSEEVVRSSAELNRMLYKIIVEGLGIEKADVVRIRIDYDVKDGRINWYYNTLQIEAYKKIPDEKVREIIDKIVSEITTSSQQVSSGLASHKQVHEYSIELVGTNSEGEKVFMVKDSRGETVGVFSTKKTGDAMKYRLVGVGIESKPFYAEGNISLPDSDISEKELLVTILDRSEKKTLDKEEAREMVKNLLSGIL